MLEINFKVCCEPCPDRETYLREDGVWAAGGRRVDVVTHIGCRHEEVCRFYISPHAFHNDMKIKNLFIDGRRSNGEK